MINNRNNSSYFDTDNLEVLNCRRLPARLSINQVAVLLNFQPYELLQLMRRGLLKCLNSPAAGANCRKYFCAAYIQKLADDPIWLTKATGCAAQAIRDKNLGQRYSSG